MKRQHPLSTSSHTNENKTPLTPAASAQPPSLQTASFTLTKQRDAAAPSDGELSSLQRVLETLDLLVQSRDHRKLRELQPQIEAVLQHGKPSFQESTRNHLQERGIKLFNSNRHADDEAAPRLMYIACLLMNTTPQFAVADAFALIKSFKRAAQALDALADTDLETAEKSYDFAIDIFKKLGIRQVVSTPSSAVVTDRLELVHELLMGRAGSGCHYSTPPVVLDLIGQAKSLLPYLPENRIDLAEFAGKCGQDLNQVKQYAHAASFFNEALAIVEGLMEKDPSTTRPNDWLLQLALAYIEEGHADKASSALAMVSEDSRSLMLFVKLHLTTGNVDQALVAFAELLERADCSYSNAHTSAKLLCSEPNSMTATPQAACTHVLEVYERLAKLFPERAAEASLEALVMCLEALPEEMVGLSPLMQERGSLYKLAQSRVVAAVLLERGVRQPSTASSTAIAPASTAQMAKPTTAQNQPPPPPQLPRLHLSAEQQEQAIEVCENFADCAISSRDDVSAIAWLRLAADAAAPPPKSKLSEGQLKDEHTNPVSNGIVDQEYQQRRRQHERLVHRRCLLMMEGGDSMGALAELQSVSGGESDGASASAGEGESVTGLWLRARCVTMPIATGAAMESATPTDTSSSEMAAISKEEVFKVFDALVRHRNCTDQHLQALAEGCYQSLQQTLPAYTAAAARVEASTRMNARLASEDRAAAEEATGLAPPPEEAMKVAQLRQEREAQRFLVISCLLQIADSIDTKLSASVDDDVSTSTSVAAALNHNASDGGRIGWGSLQPLRTAVMLMSTPDPGAQNTVEQLSTQASQLIAVYNKALDNVDTLQLQLERTKQESVPDAASRSDTAAGSSANVDNVERKSAYVRQLEWLADSAYNHGIEYSEATHECTQARIQAQLRTMEQEPEQGGQAQDGHHGLQATACSTSASASTKVVKLYELSADLFDVSCQLRQRLPQSSEQAAASAQRNLFCLLASASKRLEAVNEELAQGNHADARRLHAPALKAIYTCREYTKKQQASLPAADKTLAMLAVLDFHLHVHRVARFASVGGVAGECMQLSSQHEGESMGEGDSVDSAVDAVAALEAALRECKSAVASPKIFEQLGSLALDAERESESHHNLQARPKRQRVMAAPTVTASNDSSGVRGCLRTIAEQAFRMALQYQVRDSTVGTDLDRIALLWRRVYDCTDAPADRLQILEQVQQFAKTTQKSDGGDMSAGSVDDHGEGGVGQCQYPLVELYYLAAKAWMYARRVVSRGAGHYTKAKPHMEMAMSFLALVEHSSVGSADTSAGGASEKWALREVPEHAKRCAEDYQELLKAMESRSRSAGTGHALSRQL